jgi:hypothetical protein
MRRLGLLLLLLPALFGCGGSDALDPSVLATAVDRTQAAGGAEVSVSGRVEVDGLDDPIAFDGTGTVDPTRRRGRLSLDMSALAKLPGGAELCARGCDFDAVYDGTVFYMRSGLISAGLPEGKEWVRIDLAKALQGAGIDLDQFTQLGQDPTAQLRYLKAVSGDVRESGKETVAGVETTHYEATVDLRKVPSVAPRGERERARRSIERLIALTDQHAIPMEIWIDGRDRVRRIRFEQQLPQPAGRAKIRQTIEYERFGVKVSAEPPPDEDTVDLTDLAARGLPAQP